MVRKDIGLIDLSVASLPPDAWKYLQPQDRVTLQVDLVHCLPYGKPSAYVSTTLVNGVDEGGDGGELVGLLNIHGIRLFHRYHSFKFTLTAEAERDGRFFELGTWTDTISNLLTNAVAWNGDILSISWELCGVSLTSLNTYQASNLQINANFRYNEEFLNQKQAKFYKEWSPFIDTLRCDSGSAALALITNYKACNRPRFEHAGQGKAKDSIVTSLWPILTEERFAILEYISGSEIAAVESDAVLFRGKSLTTEIIIHVLTSTCQQLCISLLKPVVSKVLSEGMELEIDPSKISASAIPLVPPASSASLSDSTSGDGGTCEDDIENRARKLGELAAMVFSKFSDSSSMWPSEARRCLHIVSKLVERRFGRQISIATTGGFVILRLACPLIMSTGKWFTAETDLHSKQPMNKNGYRTLTILSKLLQTAANGTVLGAKEPWMAALQPHIQSSMQNFRSFLEHLPKPGGGQCNEAHDFRLRHVLHSPGLEYCANSVAHAAKRNLSSLRGSLLEAKYEQLASTLKALPLRPLGLWFHNIAAKRIQRCWHRKCSLTVSQWADVLAGWEPWESPPVPPHIQMHHQSRSGITFVTGSGGNQLNLCAIPLSKEQRFAPKAEFAMARKHPKMELCLSPTLGYTTLLHPKHAHMPFNFTNFQDVGIIQNPPCSRAQSDEAIQNRLESDTKRESCSEANDTAQHVEQHSFSRPVATSMPLLPTNGLAVSEDQRSLSSYPQLDFAFPMQSLFELILPGGIRACTTFQWIVDEDGRMIDATCATLPTTRPISLSASRFFLLQGKSGVLLVPFFGFTLSPTLGRAAALSPSGKINSGLSMEPEINYIFKSFSCFRLKPLCNDYKPFAEHKMGTSAPEANMMSFGKGLLSKEIETKSDSKHFFYFRPNQAAQSPPWPVSLGNSVYALRCANGLFLNMKECGRLTTSSELQKCCVLSLCGEGDFRWIRNFFTQQEFSLRPIVEHTNGKQSTLCTDQTNDNVAQFEGAASRQSALKPSSEKSAAINGWKLSITMLFHTPFFLMTSTEGFIQMIAPDGGHLACDMSGDVTILKGNSECVYGVNGEEYSTLWCLVRLGGEYDKAAQLHFAYANESQLEQLGNAETDGRVNSSAQPIAESRRGDAGSPALGLSVDPSRENERTLSSLASAYKFISTSAADGAKAVGAEVKAIGKAARKSASKLSKVLKLKSASKR